MRAPELLESDRLLLRRPVVDNAKVIFSTYSQDSDVTRYLTWKPHRDIDQTKAFLLRCDRAWDRGMSFPWAITLKESDRMVGMIEARVTGHRVQIGYVLARDVWGNGFATEAVRAVIGWALGESSVWRVWAFTDIDNAASARVLEKAGMHREGLLHRWASHPNVGVEARDCWAYAVWRDSP